MQPQAYNRNTDFTERTGDDTEHSAINNELDAAALSINKIRANLALLQHDDGTPIGASETAAAVAKSAADAAKSAADAANASGSMIKVSTKSLSSGSCEFTGLTGYSRYRLIIDGLTFSGILNSGGFAKIHIGTGATPTYITSGYGSRIQTWADNGGGSSGANFSQIMGSMSFPYNFPPENLVGMAICDFSGMNAAGRVLASYNAMVSEGASAGVDQAIGISALNVASAPTAIKISGSYLTITGGTASLYGIPA